MSHALAGMRVGMRSIQGAHRPFATSTHCTVCRKAVPVRCSQGFSSGAKTKKSKPVTFKPRKVDIAKELELAPANTSSSNSSAEDNASWIKVATIDSFDKPIKPVILKTGKSICLFKVGDEVYCSDAQSTAYQYPLVDAKIIDLPGGPAVEVPLDGTQYDLKTGQVLKWCPTDNPVRAVLGTLKKASQATNLPVYRTKVSEQGNVFVTLV